MEIDGHTLRVAAIDGVLAIDVKVQGAYEGTDKIVTGTFIILVGGHRVTISRVRRVHDGKQPVDEAKEWVSKALKILRDEVVAAMNHSEPQT